MVYSYRVLRQQKWGIKKATATYNNMNESQTQFIKQKKTDLQKSTFHFIAFDEWIHSYIVVFI